MNLPRFLSRKESFLLPSTFRPMSSLSPPPHPPPPSPPTPHPSPPPQHLQQLRATVWRRYVPIFTSKSCVRVSKERLTFGRTCHTHCKRAARAMVDWSQRGRLPVDATTTLTAGITQSLPSSSASQPSRLRSRSLGLVDFSPPIFHSSGWRQRG